MARLLRWTALLLLLASLLPHALSIEVTYAPPAAADASASSAPPSGSSLVLQFDSKHAPLQLTHANFFDLVLDSRQAWVVAFVAPWCSHCAAMKPSFALASTKLLSAVRFGLVDATAESSLAAQFKISSYPTIVLFPAGVKSPKTLRKHEGGRDVDSLVLAARAMIDLSRIRLLKSAEPSKLLAFFHGSPSSSSASSPTVAALPTMIVFLHAHRPSDEIAALSAIFEDQVRFGVVSSDNTQLRALFRVRSVPTFLACAPSIQSRANLTGIVECTLYDHARLGVGVQPLSNWVATFLQRTVGGSVGSSGSGEGGSAEGAKHDEYKWRRIVIDPSRSKASGASTAATNAAPVELPPLLSSAAQFAADCIDLEKGACLVIFTEAGSVATDSSPALLAAHSSLQSFLSSLHAWNAAHAKRPSSRVAALLLPTSSAFASALADAVHAPLDASEGGLTLLALLPRRNRFAHFQPSSSGDVDAAGEWLERFAGGDSKLKLEKTKDLAAVLRRAVQANAGAGEATVEAQFVSTLAAAVTRGGGESGASGDDAAAAHDEL